MVSALMAGLTPKQQTFVDEYLLDMNATAAAERAGYSTPGYGRQLMTEPDVKAEIERRQGKRAQRTEITADRVLTELARVGFVDPRDGYDAEGNLKPPGEWSDAFAAAVAGMKMRDGKLAEVKLWDKNSALDKIARHLGMLDARINLDVPKDSPLAALVKAINGETRSTLLPDDDDA